MENKKFLDEQGVQFLWSKISMEDYPNNETLIAVLNAIDETKADKDKIPTSTSQLENDSNFVSEDQVRSLFEGLNSDRTLRFYCIEDVTVVTNGISKTYPANSNVEVKFADTDVFEIVPTSDNSIMALNGFPGALGTYYSWLEGVKQFSNILFDMNNEDMYTKWNQGNQGAYQVQYAQYLNCVFWSDNPYIADLAKRTNYTLYYSSQNKNEIELNSEDFTYYANSISYSSSLKLGLASNNNKCFAFLNFFVLICLFLTSTIKPVYFSI